MMASEQPEAPELLGKTGSPNQSGAELLARRTPNTHATSSPRQNVARLFANLVGAFGAALFAWAGLRHYEETHSLVGAGFFAAQIWVVVAYLVRRPAFVVSQKTLDWALAFGGTFGGVLFRPSGGHPHWGVTAGLDLQVVGLMFCAVSFLSLGRSFGFAPADRGVKRRGSYAIVRHPIYASYVLLGVGYVLQSISLRNVIVLTFVIGCDVGRALAEERLLGSNASYNEYRSRVRWRLVPGVW